MSDPKPPRVVKLALEFWLIAGEPSLVFLNDVTVQGDLQKLLQIDCIAAAVKTVKEAKDAK